MTADLPALTMVVGLLFAVAAAAPAFAQKQGGILNTWDFDSPASMSILEESTVAAERPMMRVFNNLVLFDQHVERNSLESIIPELATGRSWNNEGTELRCPCSKASNGMTASRSRPETSG
jgi:peptide/nickel transport system substrate-binding protein